MSTPTQPENSKPSGAVEPPNPNESKELSLRQVNHKDFEMNWSLFLLEEAKPFTDLKATNEKISLLAKSYLEEKSLLESKLNSQLTINQELQKKVHDQSALMTSMQTQFDGFETQRRNFEVQAALYDDYMKNAERKDSVQQKLIDTQREKLEEIKSSGFADLKSRDAMIGKLMDEKAVLYAQKFSDREPKMKDISTQLVAAKKIVRDLVSRVRNMGTRVEELTEKLALKDKRLEEVENGIRVQIRDIKLREDALKGRELRIKEQQPRVAAPTELTKEASKELKIAKAQWEKQLREAEQRIDRLEQQLKDLIEKYDLLQLDYDAAVSDRQKVNEESDALLTEKLRTLEKDRDHFRSLYEAHQNSQKRIQHLISQAVLSAEARRNAIFNSWKAKQKEVILDVDRKLAEAEAKAEAAEKRASTMGFSREAKISETLDRMDESIAELSRTKMGILYENMDKDAEIELLKERLSVLALQGEKE